MKPPISLSQFLYQNEQSFPHLQGIAGLMGEIAHVCRRIAAECARGALRGISGEVGATNVQGEAQKKIDVLANNIFIETLQYSGHTCALISEELEMPHLPPVNRRGKFLLFFDPLDGSSNSDINVSVGSIFSVLRAPEEALTGEYQPSWALQSGQQQIAAGYAIYGQATQLVISLGQGAHLFTLERESGEFFLTHPHLQIPKSCQEFAINASNERHWEEAVRGYIRECLAGKSGVRGKDFNMRWVASLVAEAHRILMRGGVFLYPFDARDPSKPGKLRLMYECNPVAFLIEQAGGRASTARERILSVVPTHLHQRIPFIFGSAEEVLYIEAKHLPAK